MPSRRDGSSAKYMAGLRRSGESARGLASAACKPSNVSSIVSGRHDDRLRYLEERAALRHRLVDALGDEDDGRVWRGDRPANLVDEDVLGHAIDRVDRVALRLARDAGQSRDRRALAGIDDIAADASMQRLDRLEQRMGWARQSHHRSVEADVER